MFSNRNWKSKVAGKGNTRCVGGGMQESKGGGGMHGANTISIVSWEL